MKNLVLVALATLGGCAVYGQQDFNEMRAASQSGRCNDAYAIAGRTNNAVKYYNSAHIAAECEHDVAKEQNFLTYAAKLGHQPSVDVLLRRGWPVPNQERSTNNGDAIGAALINAGKAMNKPYVLQPLPNVNEQRVCRTNSLGNGQYETVCQ